MATEVQATGKALYLQLVEMRNEAGERLYLRIQLAAKLLADKAWVDDPAQGGGDEGKALDMLEDTCFADICGAISLPQMLEICRAVPSKATWKTNRYNLRRMYAEMQERKKAEASTGGSPVPPHTPRTPDWKDQLIAQLKAELKTLKAELHESRQEAVRMRKVLNRIHQAQEALVAT